MKLAISLLNDECNDDSEKLIQLTTQFSTKTQ